MARSAAARFWHWYRLYRLQLPAAGVPKAADALRRNRPLEQRVVKLGVEPTVSATGGRVLRRGAVVVGGVGRVVGEVVVGVLRVVRGQGPVGLGGVLRVCLVEALVLLRAEKALKSVCHQTFNTVIIYDKKPKYRKILRVRPLFKGT